MLDMLLPMNEKIVFGVRLKKARKTAKLTQSALAEQLGVGQNTISDWESGKYLPGDHHLHDLIKRFDIDVGSLEEMEASRVVRTTDDLGDIVSVPEYDLNVAAGGGAVISHEDPAGHWPWPRRFFETIGRSPQTFMILTVSGDSMEPTLRSGDKLLIDTSRHNPAVPGIYVVAMEDMAVVKRLELIPGSRPTRIRISSDNPLHQAYEAHLADVQVVGWVSAVVSRM